MKMVVASFLILLFSAFCESCYQLDHNTLISFYHHISSPPLNWSQSTDCCQWEGIACTIHDGIPRATHLWLPEKHLSGTISPLLAHLPFLTHLNLSHNYFSGPLPLQLFHSFNHLKTLDLSFNLLSGPLQMPQSSSTLPLSLQSLDLSSNHFNGSIDPASFLHQALNLVSFNISNNTFTNSIPSSICKVSKLLKILDFSSNKFIGPISPGLSECHHLQVFRAGENFLSGSLPQDLFNATTLKEISLHNNQFSGGINSIDKLSNLTILQLHFNQLSGEIPPNIGLLSSLEKLVLHTNSLSGTLPPSLMNCSELTTLLLRENQLVGEISSLNFSGLRRLQVIDLGRNNFTGEIPHTLCLCSSLIAVRFSHNLLVGEIPPCMASLKSLLHFAAANNYLSNVVGAFKILSHCHNILVLILYSSFYNEMMPGDNELLHLNGFQNLQILTVGECKLRGQIPSWVSKLRNLKQLDLSKNEIWGPIPSWLGSMPSLVILNLTQNLLSGNIPRQLCQMPALIADVDTSSDLRFLPLPMLIDGLQYMRFFNMRRGLDVGSNNLSGRIPEELGQLKLLQVLDLSYNNFNGGIPTQLSNISNLEKMNVSGNHLTGKIPYSLSGLHFLSSFSVADNDLEGEIPRGGQFDTFGAESFEGNPKICGYIVNKSCVEGEVNEEEDGDGDGDDWICWYNLPLGLGFSVGLFAVALSLLLKSWWSGGGTGRV